PSFVLFSAMSSRISTCRMSFTRQRSLRSRLIGLILPGGRPPSLALALLAASLAGTTNHDEVCSKHALSVVVDWKLPINCVEDRAASVMEVSCAQIFNAYACATRDYSFSYAAGVDGRDNG